MNSPILFAWTDDGTMKPLARMLRFCDRQFVVGETYPLVVHEERSTNSHNHFFASVHEAWKNIPERLSARFPTAEHLRKWSLIKAGYADERSIACATADEALRVAAFIKPMDDFSIVVVADATIKVFTAKSQSSRAMDKKTFQESKQAVLDIAAELIGVDVATLAANAAIPPHSPQDGRSPVPPSPETMPAPEPAPCVSGAGATSSPAEGQGTAALSGEPKQAGGGVNHDVANAAGLPEGFLKVYARGLGAATNKPKSLQNCHEKVLPTLGGEPSEDDLAELRTVYGLFKRHLGRELSGEDLAAQLFELGAA